VTGYNDDDDDYDDDDDEEEEIKEEEKNKGVKTGRKERILLRRDSFILEIVLWQRSIAWPCRSSVMYIIDIHTIYSYRTSQLSQQSDFLHYVSNFSAHEHLTSQSTYRWRQKCQRPRSVKVFTDSHRYCNTVRITNAIYFPVRRTPRNISYFQIFDTVFAATVHFVSQLQEQLFSTYVYI
jgi:hypothetical protein